MGNGVDEVGNDKDEAENNNDCLDSDMDEPGNVTKTFFNMTSSELKKIFQYQTGFRFIRIVWLIDSHSKSSKS